MPQAELELMLRGEISGLEADLSLQKAPNLSQGSGQLGGGRAPSRCAEGRGLPGGWIRWKYTFLPNGISFLPPWPVIYMHLSFW